MERNKTNNLGKLGFTLIELLVVISIIGFVASVFLSAIQQSRARSRDALRVQNVRSLINALELYNLDNGGYPKTFNPGRPVSARLYCSNPTNYIPNLVPKYLDELPGDPALDCAGTLHAWSYASDGKNFKLITHGENSFNAQSIFVDPAWDNGPDDCVIDGPSTYHYGMWTSGAVCWSI